MTKWAARWRRNLLNPKNINYLTKPSNHEHLIIQSCKIVQSTNCSAKTSNHTSNVLKTVPCVYSIKISRLWCMNSCHKKLNICRRKELWVWIQEHQVVLDYQCLIKFMWRRIQQRRLACQDAAVHTRILAIEGFYILILKIFLFTI